MKKSSEEIRRKIVGLGEASVKKSYYPLLQDKIKELEHKQDELIELVRSLEEREVELQELLEEKTALLSEVNHRVKNNLQIISSILSIDESDVNICEAERFENARNRIDVLSLVYQQFLFSNNYSEVAYLSFLKALSMEVSSELGITGIDIFYEAHEREIIIDIDMAIPLAIISYEMLRSAYEIAVSHKAVQIKFSVMPEESIEEKKRYRQSIFISCENADADKTRREDILSSSVLVEALVYQISGVYHVERSDSGYWFSLDFG